MVGFWKTITVSPMNLVLGCGFPMQHAKMPTLPLKACCSQAEGCFVFLRGALVYAGWRSPRHCHSRHHQPGLPLEVRRAQGHPIIRGHQDNCTVDIFHRTLRILLKTELLQLNFSSQRNKATKQRKDIKLRDDMVRFVFEK